jgi:hypothetical protein
MIPGASKAATVNVPVPNSICGNGAGLVTAMGKIAKTICSKSKIVFFVPQFVIGVSQKFVSSERQSSINNMISYFFLPLKLSIE